MWQSVANQSDIDALMETFCDFHDGCVKELHIWGGYYVAADLKMACPEGPDWKCRMLLQRQCGKPSAVELLFDGVSFFSLSSADRFDRIIFHATLRLEEGRIIWNPFGDFDETKYKFGESEGIVACKLWWRQVDDGLGPELRYGQLMELPDGFEI
jgi:hypothetical protein